MFCESPFPSGARAGRRIFGATMLVLWFLLLLVPSSWSHGPGAHPEQNRDHMDTMRSVKARVPRDLGLLQRVPLQETEETREAGRELFRGHCSVCHGPGGRGNGPAAPGMSTRPSDFLDLEHSNMYGAGEKFWIITHGVEETGMPGFGKTLSDEERWLLVLHILSLQRETKD